MVLTHPFTATDPPLYGGEFFSPKIDLFQVEMHRGDDGVNFGRKRRKKQKFSKKRGEIFSKMATVGPGPGQAAGTVFRSKIESQHINFIFSKIIIF